VALGWTHFERVYDGGEETVRHVLMPAERCDSAHLAIGFAAVVPRGDAPRYHYIRAMADVPAHRMFILDEHGPHGCWYLGHNRDWTVGRSIERLIAETTESLRIPSANVTAFGSSKGGWAALYFAARAGIGRVIAGEPQTRLGDHLFRGDPDTAEWIAGGRSEADRAFLDGILDEAWAEAADLPEVTLMVGTGIYRERHIDPFLQVSRERGVGCDLQVRDFEAHDDLRFHFPDFLSESMLAVARGA